MGREPHIRIDDGKGAFFVELVEDAAAVLTRVGDITAAAVLSGVEASDWSPPWQSRLLDAAGAGPALAVLTLMHERYGDPAFAPAPLLAEHAAARQAFC